MKMKRNFQNVSDWDMSAQRSKLKMFEDFMPRQFKQREKKRFFGEMYSRFLCNEVDRIASARCVMLNRQRSKINEAVLGSLKVLNGL